MKKVGFMETTIILDKFIELLKNEDYFEAHEVLEKAWHKLKRDGDKKANLAKGLINAAVAFEHIKRATPTAMIKAKKTYAGYLRYKHLCEDKLSQWNEACKIVDEIAVKQELNLNK